MTTHKLEDPAAHGYLDGSRFDENVTFRYEFATPLRDRLSILTDLARSRRILHIGCCDHIPLLQEKIAAGSWLHGRLTKVATHCVGIDIDAEAVRRACAISGLSNIFYGNIAGDDAIPQIVDDRFDSVILGEVLEHIGNPVNFLSKFLTRYRENIGNIIITVPNAFRGGNIRNIFRDMETINSDHRFFFTPYTLAKVTWDAGLTPLSMQTALYSSAGVVKRAILNRFPLLAEDLVYIGAPRR